MFLDLGKLHLFLLNIFVILSLYLTNNKSTRGPYYLGTYDLANIKDSGALFIRKVAKEIDPNIFRLFPVSHESDIPYIQWPKEVKVSPTTNFDEIIKYWKRKNEE